MASSTEEARFAVNLEGNAAEHATKDAAALEKLEQALQADMAALRGMQGALRNLQGGATVNIATMRNLRDQIAAQKAKVASNTQAFVDMGGKFRGTKPAANAAMQGIKDLSEALRSAPGPVGQLVGRLGGLRAIVAGGVLVAGIAATVAALVALTAAVVAAGAAVLRFGIVAADARRNELLHLEALTKLRIGYMGLFAMQGRNAMSGQRLQAIVDRVSGSVALGRGEVAKYTEQLYKMGLRGQNLQDALEGTSIVAATQGDAAAASFANWAAGANMTGQSVRRLTDDVKARLGPIARAQMLSLSVQSMKLKENLAAIFADVKIEGFLAPLKEVVDLFSQASASGRALKSIVNAIFGGLGEQLKPLGLVVKRFFQGMVIGALLVGIGFLRLRKLWRDTFGDSEALKGIDLMTIAVYAGAAAVGALAAVFTALAAAAAAPIAAVYAIYKGAVLMKDAMLGAVDALAAMKNAFKESGADGGKGLAAGLLSGRIGVIDAARTLGSSAIEAFKKRLDIRSPSRAMFRLGALGGEGAAGGFRAQRPMVRAAAARLVQEPRELIERAQPRMLAAVRNIARPERTERDAPPALRVPASTPTPRASRGASRLEIALSVRVEAAAGAGAPDIGDAVAAAVGKVLPDVLRKVAADLGAPVTITTEAAA